MLNYTFDVFLSYADADKAWVRNWLLPRLTAEGLKACTPDDFDIGVARLINVERAVGASRCTLLILTNDWVTSEWSQFTGLLALTADPTNRKRQMLPLLLDPCLPPDRLMIFTAADFTVEENWEEQLRRVIAAVRDEQQLPEVGPQLSRVTAVANLTLAALPTERIPNIGSLPAGSRMPLSRNPLFVGREETLKDLAKTLKEGKTTAIGQVAVTAGLGGIGKSQLAAEFVHRYGQFFAGGVFWLSFADPAAVPAEIAACGGIRGLDLPKFSELELDQQVMRVQQEWQHPIPRLLIFDNCEEEELLAQWRPTTGGCRVLVTSRRSEWDAALDIEALTLPVLPRHQSVVLLQRLCPNIDATDATAIAAELGDLPLALHVAGSYLRRYRKVVTPADYLAKLSNAPLEILASRLAGSTPTRHELDVARTFALSYEQLDIHYPIDALAEALLARAAYFAPGESIPTELLARTTPHADDREAEEAALDVVDALRRLSELGLIDYKADGPLRLHRLLAAFARKVSPGFSDAQNAVEHTLLAMLHQTNEEETMSELPQIHLRFVTDNALKRHDELASDLAFELSRYLTLVGDYSGALGYEEQALTIRAHLLPPNPFKHAQSLNGRAVKFQRLKRYDDALHSYKEALATLDSIAEYRDNATKRLQAMICANMGVLLMNRGEMDEAYIYLDRALKLRSQLPDVEPLHRASSFNNLAMWNHLQGEYDEALSLYRKSLLILKRSGVRMHGNRAQVLQNMGEIFYDRKMYIAARRRFECAHAIYTELSDAWQDDHAYNLHALAVCCYEQDAKDLACKYMLQSAEIRKLILGPHDKDTRDSYKLLEQWSCP